MEPDEGSFKWGVTTSQSYFPKDNNEFFDGHEENMLDWIAPYSQNDTLESTLRGFLGRMLFSGDDVYKPVRVLSGGEKVRLMLARMMLFGSNVLVVDQPTNHLDLESITAVNNGVRDFKGTVLFASHDHEFVQTIATRIIEIREKGVLDKECTYDEFLDFRETYEAKPLSFLPPEAKLFSIHPKQTAGLPPIQRRSRWRRGQALPGRGIFAMTWRVHCRRPAAGARGG